MMDLQSKFEVGEKVWFEYQRKYYLGTISDISFWDDITGFSYKIEFGGDIQIEKTVHENDLYKNKEDIIEKIFITEE